MSLIALSGAIHDALDGNRDLLGHVVDVAGCEGPPAVSVLTVAPTAVLPARFWALGDQIPIRLLELCEMALGSQLLLRECQSSCTSAPA